MALAPGVRLGPYEITAQIGAVRMTRQQFTEALVHKSRA